MADACDNAGGNVAAKAAGNAAACSKGAGRSSLHNNVGDRLYSQIHVCNHARCAANDPNYNVKPPTPPKKFLVAKSRYRTYGGRASPDEKGGGGGGAEAKATKNSKTGGRKDSADHDQSHALHSLANSDFQFPQNNGGRAARYKDVPFSKGQGGNKEQDRKVSAHAHSALQHGRAWDSSVKNKTVQSSASAGQQNLNANFSVGKPKPSVRKAATPAAAGRAQASGSSRTSGVTESQSEACGRRPLTHRARRDNGSSILAPVTPAADQCNTQPWEESPSPRSSITSISITQIISASKRGGDAGGENDEGKIEHHHQQHRQAEDGDVVLFSSPSASVGSNCDEEIISSIKETEVTLEDDNLNHPVKLHGSEPCNVETPATPSTKELQKPSLRRERDSQRGSSSTPLSVKSKRSIIEGAAPASPTASVASTNTSLSGSSTVTTTTTSSESTSSQPTDDDTPAESATPKVTARPEGSRYLNSTIASARIPTQTQTPTSVTPSKPSTLVESPLHPPTPTSPPFSSSVSDVESTKSKRSVDEPSKVSSPSPTRKPTRTQSCGSPFAPSGPSSQLARAFTDLYAKTVARKAASSKGVRSIELRGGIARSYSKTTITSLNVTTTTIEEASEPNAKISSHQHPRGSVVPFELARSGSTPVGTKPPWQSSSKENARSNGGWNASSTARNADTNLKKAGSGTGLKFSRKAKSTTTTMFDELLAKSERVSLKHGEVAERRLSEEWMTNHALEGVVKNIADTDHRVKVLVHAFETLASLPDSEGGHNGDNNVNMDTQLVNEILSAAPIAA